MSLTGQIGRRDSNQRQTPVLFSPGILCSPASPGRISRRQVPSPWCQEISACQDRRSPLPWIPSVGVPSPTSLDVMRHRSLQWSGILETKKHLDYYKFKVYTLFGTQERQRSHVGRQYSLPFKVRWIYSRNIHPFRVSDLEYFFECKNILNSLGTAVKRRCITWESNSDLFDAA